MTPTIQDEKFITYDEKPVYAKDYRAVQDSLKYTPRLTIVMQGPLRLEEHFTYETLKLYQKTFPDCPVVLSTWKSENADEIQKIKSLGVHVLQNDPPEWGGLSNINYQILSTQKGLAYAKKLGSEYVIKTRTDQRFYETNLPDFLFNLLKLFPVYDCSKQKSRLVTLSLNTFKYRLYDISDMFLFGYIDDVIKFWSCEFDYRTELTTHKNMYECCKNCIPEIYFTTEYLKKIGHQCEWTLEDSWLVYSRYFCIIDSIVVGMYWPKYSNKINRWRNFFGHRPEMEELTFKEWINLYLGIKNKKYIPEHLLVEGWSENSTLDEGEYLFINTKNKCLKKKFYRRVNSKGYLCFYIFGLRVLKIKI